MQDPTAEPLLEPTAEYVRVALDLPVEQAYQYVIPPELMGQVQLGSIVRAPVKTRVAHGCVVEFEDKPATPRVRPIEAVISAPFALTSELIELGRWMADYYITSPGETLRAISFLGFVNVHEPTQRLMCLADAEHWLRHPEIEGPDGKRLTAHQRRVVDSLLARGNEPTPPALVREDAEVSDSVLNGMADRGLLERVEAAMEVEDEYAEGPPEPVEPLALTKAQEGAIDAVCQSMRKREFRSFLLHGVTGSGKTEVYLRVIEEGLRQGRQAVVLVPEISLTPQAVARFRARFGGIVGIYHHRQTLRQKFDLWRRIHDGRVKIVIGARSAVFSPFPSLGVIVVDEEHTSSYKQDATPRYHARDVALYRASRLKAVAILGSATPSLESCANARSGKHTLLDLPDRIGEAAMPPVELVDMARELKKTHGNPGVFSDRLRGALARRLEAGEQSILLLNRRGYAAVNICLQCETAERCPECDASLTYHRTHDQLLCHLCGRRKRRVEICPQCGSKEMALIGLGTQKVEEALVEAHPTARVLRMDSDSARGRKAWIEAWEKIESGDVDIILGTQMIAKGLHLDRVTLVGVVSADGALFQPDFRAAERAFSLLAQAAGRAGRGKNPGEVIIQTYCPAHYAIQLACQHDYLGFYEKEMQLRRALRFPPMQRLIGILVAGEESNPTAALAGRLAGLLRGLARVPDYNGISVLGPAPCPIERIRGRWRWRILIRGARSEPMHNLARAGLKEFERVDGRSQVVAQVDVDPQDLM